MTVTKQGVRITKVAKEINLGIESIAQHLRKKGFDIEERPKPNTKLTSEMYDVLIADFRDQIKLKERADSIQFKAKRSDIELDANYKPAVKKEEEVPLTNKKGGGKAENDLQQQPASIDNKKQENSSEVSPDEGKGTSLANLDKVLAELEEQSSSIKDSIAVPKDYSDTTSDVKHEELPAIESFLKEERPPKSEITTNTQNKSTVKTEESHEKKVEETSKPDLEPKVQDLEQEKKVIKAKLPEKEEQLSKQKEEQELSSEPKKSIAVDIDKKEAKEELKVVTQEKEKPAVVEEPVLPVLPTNSKDNEGSSKKKEEEGSKLVKREKEVVQKNLEKDLSKVQTNNHPKEEVSKPKQEQEQGQQGKKKEVVLGEKTKTDGNVRKGSEPKAEDKGKRGNDEQVKVKVIDKIDLNSINQRTRPDKKKKGKQDRDGRNKSQGNNRRKGGDSNVNRKDQDKAAPNAATGSAEGRSNKPRPKLQKKQPKNNQQGEGGKYIERVVKPKLEGPKVVGKIDLSATSDKGGEKKKRRRKRIVKLSDKNKEQKQGQNSGSSSGKGGNNDSNRSNRNRSNNSSGGGNRRSRRNDRRKKKGKQQEDSQVSEKEIHDKIKETMAKLSGSSKGRSTRAKLKRQKREQAASKEEVGEVNKNLIQVTEFISANELAKMMDVSVTKIITICFNLGIIVSINQRLDAEVIELVADELNYEVEFISVAEEDDIFEEEIEEDPDLLRERSPIVTIMGHVDHGKTSLLDYIREANVVAGEVGGITQHIGAYEVTNELGKKITFLDTPGHEAFTAMRARGAKLTDVAVIVIAADDSIMPQTKEAISHAQAADVPMIFAINKIDRPDADPERIKTELANMNLLVEDWGGTYQSQEISAKFGTNVDELLEKISLEAEMLELKANPERDGIGTVVEASLDKGRGYTTTILVQTGSIEIGDSIVAGQYSGRVKAMFNERGTNVKHAGPAQPVLILGLNGAPQAGDRLRVMPSEQEARAIALRREQIVREQQQRANKHITLDEIGRRLALGNFQELNLIVKGDVDGSVEALCDSLLKLSTEEIQVKIIHRSVGAIKESDVLLASASDAIIVGFQVRPTPNARRNAQQENIEIRLYSIIYDAIEEIKSAMEGMLQPKVEERFVCNIEVKEVFKISKVGTIAGCFVTEGKVNKDTKIRLLRDGIVVYTGEISSLKRFKDDVKDVLPGQECGIGIKNFNDIKMGDVIEGYEEIEVKRKLK